MTVGNFRRPPDDTDGMDCERCREELSARLDGEADPAVLPLAEAHVEGCAACARWEQRAAVVTRRVRTAPVDPAPDLVARVLPAAPAPQPAWRRVGPRVALAVVGIVQVGLGLVALFGGDATGHATMLGAGMAHMNHESAAWNLAIGAAFVAGAWWRRHLAGLLPVLGAFIVVLALLSGLDLAAGRVDPDRVATHLVLLVGFVLSVLVARSVPDRGPGPVHRAGVDPGGAEPERADRWPMAS